MKRPAATYSSVDTALLLAALVSWAVAMIDQDAGRTLAAWGQIGLAYLFISVFLARETRRWQWELR